MAAAATRVAIGTWAERNHEVAWSALVLSLFCGYCFGDSWGGSESFTLSDLQLVLHVL